MISLFAASLSLVLSLRPNLAPSTSNQARITDIALEPRVALRDYAHHPAVSPVISRAGGAEAFLGINPDLADKLGTVVHFSFEVTGLRGTRLKTRWTLFDAATMQRAGESEKLAPLDMHLSAGKKDSDVGSWETWVRADVAPGTALFVRLELYNEKHGLRLAFRDTGTFQAP